MKSASASEHRGNLIVSRHFRRRRGTPMADHRRGGRRPSHQNLTLLAGIGGSFRDGPGSVCIAKVTVLEYFWAYLRLAEITGTCVKWSQVQILSARQRKPLPTSVGRGFLFPRHAGRFDPSQSKSHTRPSPRAQAFRTARLSGTVSGMSMCWANTSTGEQHAYWSQGSGLPRRAEAYAQAQRHRPLESPRG